MHLPVIWCCYSTRWCFLPSCAQRSHCSCDLRKGKYILHSPVHNFSESNNTLEWAELMIVHVHVRIRFPYWRRVNFHNRVCFWNYFHGCYDFHACLIAEGPELGREEFSFETPLWRLPDFSMWFWLHVGRQLLCVSLCWFGGAPSFYLWWRWRCGIQVCQSFHHFIWAQGEILGSRV